MDWLDFLFGMCVGAAICEDEFEEEQRQRTRDYEFDKDAFEQYLFAQKVVKKFK